MSTRSMLTGALALFLALAIIGLSGCHQTESKSSPNETVTLAKQAELPSDEPAKEPEPEEEKPAQLCATVDKTELTVTWEENGSVLALRELAKDGLTVDLHPYGGFEQGGDLGQPIVREDVQQTAVCGDIMLYQGHTIVLLYGSNDWAYTKLGHIDAPEAEQIKTLLGGDAVTLKLFLRND